MKDDPLLGLPPIPPRWYYHLPEGWTAGTVHADVEQDAGWADAHQGDEQAPTAVGLFRFRPSDPDSMICVLTARSSRELLGTAERCGYELPEMVEELHEWKAAEADVAPQLETVRVESGVEVRVRGICFLGRTEAEAFKMAAAELARIREVQGLVVRRLRDKLRNLKPRRGS